MSDLDTLLAEHPPTPETAVTVVRSDRTCRRHDYVYGGPLGDFWLCRRCRKPKDDARSRRGRSSDRLGKDQERRIERVYGPRKVGEYGDAIDLLGRDFAWQSKATRGAMPAWLAAVDTPVIHEPPAIVALSVTAMLPILGSRHPLVICSWVRNGGLAEGRTRDRIWVRGDHWRELHGGAWNAWVVMSGECFLTTHGRDEEDR